MIWILKMILLVSLQAHAQTTPETTSANPPAEIAVMVPSTVSETAAVVNENSAVSNKNLKESEIPVNLETTKKAASSESPFLKIFLSLGIVAVMGGAAYFWLRKYRYKNPQSQATQIKVLSQHFLGPKKSLAIVRVAGESVLIGVTDTNISMIKSLSLLDEDIPEETPREFQTVFARKNKIEKQHADDMESKDEFSISGIKDFVSVKLKNMRTLE
ncbi:MAG: FliO/MopB family protein [Pseudobdellovibrionaceae bacterium]